MKRFLFLCLVGLSCSAGSFAQTQAVKTVKVLKNTTLYRQPDQAGSIARMIPAGDIAKVVGEPSGGWVRIQVVEWANTIEVYALEYEVFGLPSPAEKTEKVERVRSLRPTFNLMAHGYHFSQPERIYPATADESRLEIGNLSGQGFGFQMGGTFPWTTTIGLRAIIGMHQLKQTGAIKVGSAPPTEESLSSTTTFLSGELGFKYKPMLNNPMWLAVGVSYDRSVHTDFKYSGTDEVPVEAGEYPSYYSPRVALGGDIALNPGLVFTIEIRASTYANSFPMSMTIGGAIGLGWSL